MPGGSSCLPTLPRLAGKEMQPGGKRREKKKKRERKKNEEEEKKERREEREGGKRDYYLDSFDLPYARRFSSAFFCLFLSFDS